MQKQPYTGLLIWLSIYVLFRIAGEMAALLFLGIENAAQILSLNSDKENLRNIILQAQGIAHFISYTLPAVFIIFILDKNDLPGRQYPFGALVLYLSGCLLVLLLFFPTLEWLIFLNKQLALPNFMQELDIKAEKLTNFILGFENEQEFLLGLFVIALLPAIGEELLFRAVLQNKLLHFFSNPHVAIFIGAAMFSLLHFQFAGFFPRWALGAIFGYAYFYSKNLFFPIFLHLFNNGLTLCVAFFYQKNITELQSQKAEYLFLDYLFIFMTLAMGFVLGYFLKKRLEHEQQ